MSVQKCKSRTMCFPILYFYFVVETKMLINSTYSQLIPS